MKEIIISKLPFWLSATEFIPFICTHKWARIPFYQWRIWRKTRRKKNHWKNVHTKNQIKTMKSTIKTAVFLFFTLIRNMICFFGPSQTNTNDLQPNIMSLRNRNELQRERTAIFLEWIKKSRREKSFFPIMCQKSKQKTNQSFFHSKEFRKTFSSVCELLKIFLDGDAMQVFKRYNHLFRRWKYKLLHLYCP